MKRLFSFLFGERLFLVGKKYNLVGIVRIELVAIKLNVTLAAQAIFVLEEMSFFKS